MDYIDAASAMAGRSRLEGSGAGHVTNAHAVTGTAMADSSDGTVLVDLGGDVTTGDGSQWVEVQTDAHVLEGDQVDVLLVGEAGRGMSPVIYGVPGGGDRMAASVSNAETLAEQAEAVATATGQHFWPDSSGVHVTEVTQGEWSDSTSTSYHSGANVLLNALGQLFRDGLNNILAIVSGTDPGVAIYDGEGNTADNIMALFSKTLIRIGGRLLGTGTSTASVQFFQSDASQTDVTATHTVGSTTPPTGPDDVYGVNHGVQVTTSTDDSELGEGAEGHAAWAALDLFADVNPDYEAGHAMLKATTGGTPYDSSTDPTLGVLRQVADNGTEGSRIYGSAAEIQLNDTVHYKTGVVTVEQAINVLSSPVTLFTGTYAQTHSAAVTLSESAANFSRLEFICENNDGERTSVTVTDPNGKHFNVVMLTIAGPTGTGTYAYMKAKSFSINGTSVTCRTYTYNGQTIYRHGSVTLRNGVAVSATQTSEEIGIVKVLGWR